MSLSTAEVLSLRSKLHSGATSMGIVLNFQSALGRPPRSRAGGEKTGKILFFTGVRYERMDREDSSRAWPSFDRAAQQQARPQPRS
jgi:hypothetical protein